MDVYLVREDGGGGGQGHGAREGEGAAGRFGQGGGFGVVPVPSPTVAESVFLFFLVFRTRLRERAGENGVDVWMSNSDSPPIQLLTRLDGLSPGPWLLLLLNSMDGAGRGILLEG